jgi:hypothetical protein
MSCALQYSNRNLSHIDLLLTLISQSIKVKTNILYLRKTGTVIKLGILFSVISDKITWCWRTGIWREYLDISKHFREEEIRDLRFPLRKEVDSVLRCDAVWCCRGYQCSRGMCCLHNTSIPIKEIHKYVTGLYCCSCRWGETTYLNCGHQHEYCSSPRWYKSMERHGGILPAPDSSTKIIRQLYQPSQLVAK